MPNGAAASHADPPLPCVRGYVCVYVHHLLNIGMASAFALQTIDRISVT
jgi:hypothetical protein